MGLGVFLGHRRAEASRVVALRREPARQLAAASLALCFVLGQLGPQTITLTLGILLLLLHRTEVTRALFRLMVGWCGRVVVSGAVRTCARRVRDVRVSRGCISVRRVRWNAVCSLLLSFCRLGTSLTKPELNPTKPNQTQPGAHLHLLARLGHLFARETPLLLEVLVHLQWRKGDGRGGRNDVKHNTTLNTPAASHRRLQTPTQHTATNGKFNN